MANEWLTAEDIANELNIHPETVRTWIRNRELPAVQLKRSYRIKREDYNEFLRRRYTGFDEEKGQQTNEHKTE